eukprot:jgi/Mesvir1/3215/Mv16366-RA.1
MPKEGDDSPIGEQSARDASYSSIQSEMSDLMSRLQAPHASEVPDVPTVPEAPEEVGEDEGMLEYLKKPPPPSNIWDKMPPPVRVVRAKATGVDWRRAIGCNRRTATRILFPLMGGLLLLAIVLSLSSKGSVRSQLLSATPATAPKRKAAAVDSVELPPKGFKKVDLSDDGFSHDGRDGEEEVEEEEDDDEEPKGKEKEKKGKEKPVPKPAPKEKPQERGPLPKAEPHLGSEPSFTTRQLVKPATENSNEPDPVQVDPAFDTPLRIEEEAEGPAEEEATDAEEAPAAAPKLGGLSLPLISGDFLKSVMMGTAGKDELASGVGNLPTSGFTTGAATAATQGATDGTPTTATPAPAGPALDRVPQCTKAKSEAVHRTWPAHPQMPSFKNDICGDHQLRIDLNAAMRRRVPGDPPGYVAPPVVHPVGARPHISRVGSPQSIPRRLPPGKTLHPQTIRAGLHFNKPAGKAGAKAGIKPGLHKAGVHKPGLHKPVAHKGPLHGGARKGKGHRRLLEADLGGARETLDMLAHPGQGQPHRQLLGEPIKVPNVALNSEEWKELNWFRRNEHVTPQDINLFSGDADTNTSLVHAVVHLLKEHTDEKHSCHKRGQLCGAAGKHAGLNWCTGVLGACAVVGNGRSLHGKLHGEAIDKHDTIIRIGHVPITGYAPDVGQRTTITHQRNACFYPSTIESCKTQDFDVAEKWFHKERYPVPLIWHAQPLFGAPPVWVVDGKKPAFTTESMTRSDAAEALYKMLEPWVIRQGQAVVRGKQSPLMPSNGFKVVMALLSSGLCSRIDAYGFTHDGVDHYYDVSGPAHMPTAGMSSYNVAGLEYFVLRVANAQGMVCLM